MNCDYDIDKLKTIKSGYDNGLVEMFDEVLDVPSLKEYKKKKLQEIVDGATDNSVMPFTITTKNL